MFCFEIQDVLLGQNVVRILRHLSRLVNNIERQEQILELNLVQPAAACHEVDWSVNVGPVLAYHRDFLNVETILKGEEVFLL